MTDQAVLETKLGVPAPMPKDKLSVAASDQPATDAPVAQPAVTPPASNVQIVNADERHLEIRCYNTPQNGCCGWLMLIEDAVDLARWWWVEQGRTQAPWGGLAPQQRFGRIWVSIPSDRLVYVRGADAWGRPTTTGFLFPRAVVEALAARPIPQDKQEHGS